MARYKVIVMRELIVYAASPDEAPLKVLKGINVGGATFRVASVEELPPIEAEARGPDVDVAPAREAQK